MTQNRKLVSVLVVLTAGAALAQGQAQKPTQAPAGQTQKAAQPQAGQPSMADMTKYGPWTRKPTNEAQAKKEITEFMKKEEELQKAGDFEAMFNRVDYPVYMVTDDSKGMVQAKEYSREQYVSMMKPMFESSPKDLKYTHKPTITLLSDSMASVVDDYTMTMGKQKFTGRNHSLMVKKDGQWKWKTMAEAGWGDMSATGTGGAGTEPTPMQKK